MGSATASLSLLLALTAALGAADEGFSCCYDGCDKVRESSCEPSGSWCAITQDRCEGSCSGTWCPNSPPQRSTTPSPSWHPHRHHRRRRAPTPPPPAPVGMCPEGWQQASWTYFISYPPCCPDLPIYDPSFPKDECEYYSGCEYEGYFEYIPHQTLDWVKSHHIVGFTSGHGDNYLHGSKSIRIQALNQTVEAIVADTCSDGDWSGCMETASPSGYLIDMEYWTVVNLFGGNPDDIASGQVCWQFFEEGGQAVLV